MLQSPGPPLKLAGTRSSPAPGDNPVSSQEDIMKLFKSLSVMLLLSAAVAHADWTLDNDASDLNFISIKASDIAEVHTFDQLEGTVEPDGSATVIVKLASVDTLIPVRDERMREMLFEVKVFPVATITTKVDPDVIAKLAPGDTAVVTAEVLVELHGEAAPLVMDLRVTRLTDSRIAVASVKPIVVNAGMFNLVDGVERLREVAGLPNISKAVPVTFYLTFDAPKG